MAGKSLQGKGNGKSKSNGYGNLQMWPKGVSGNPAGGKPKALTIAKIWRDIAEAVDPDDEKKRQRVAVLGLKCYEMGKEGNIPAAKLFLDRSYGTALLEEIPEPEGAETASALFVQYLRAQGKDHLVMFAEFMKKNGNGHDKG